MKDNAAPDFSERRKYARLAIKSRVVLRVEGDTSSPPKEYLGLGKNVGAEGILLVTEKKFDPGTIVVMEIDFPGYDDSLSIKGEVKWSNHVPEMGTNPDFYDTGVRFLHINKKHVRMLLAFVCGDLAEDVLPDLNGSS